MVPFRDWDFSLEELAEALAAATGGASRFRVCPDADPLPAPWGGGRRWVVQGAPGGAAFPGVVVIAAPRAGLSAWDVFEQCHPRVADVLRRRLPRRVTWRLLFEEGGRLLAPARIGHARVGECLLR